jgi:hypothetical protein
VAVWFSLRENEGCLASSRWSFLAAPAVGSLQMAYGVVTARPASPGNSLARAEPRQWQCDATPLRLRVMRCAHTPGLGLGVKRHLRDCHCPRCRKRLHTGM